MTDLLILIVITSIALYGSKVTWQEGMVFEKPKKWLDWQFWEKMERPAEWGGSYNKKRHLWGKYLSKPLYACPACMASVWGSIIYIHYMHWSVFGLIFFDVAVCGLTWILMWQFPFDD